MTKEEQREVLVNQRAASKKPRLTQKQWQVVQAALECMKEHDCQSLITTKRLRERLPYSKDYTRSFLVQLHDKNVFEKIGAGFYCLGEQFGALQLPDGFGLTKEEQREVFLKQRDAVLSGQIIPKLTPENIGTPSLLNYLNKQLDKSIQDGPLSIATVQSKLKTICSLPESGFNDKMTHDIFETLLRLEMIQLQPNQSNSLKTLFEQSKQKLAVSYQSLLLSSNDMSSKFQSLERKGYTIHPFARIHHLIVERLSQGLAIFQTNEEKSVHKWSSQEINHLLEATQLFNRQLDGLWKRSKPGSIQSYLDYVFMQNERKQNQCQSSQLAAVRHIAPLQKQKLYRELIGTQARLQILTEQKCISLDADKIALFYQPLLKMSHPVNETNSILQPSEMNSLRDSLTTCYESGQVDRIIRKYKAKAPRKERMLRSTERRDLDHIPLTIRSNDDGRGL